jgi:enolase
VEDETTIERITAKKVFKNSKISVKITTLTRTGIGYDIIDVENPDYVVSDIENIIAPELVGYPASDQDFMDSIICGTSVDNPNITMGVSISISRAAANSIGMPLFRYVGGSLSTELPVVGCSLLTDNSNELIAIPMAESIDEMITCYEKILSELSSKYDTVNIYGKCVCNNIFDELDNFKFILNDIAEEEDVKILVGASIYEYEYAENQDIYERISSLDYLESPEIVEFDGTLAIDGIDEAADFSKIEPYTMGTLTEMYHYINYILDKGLTPIIMSNNTSFSHIAVGLRVPFLRSNINSNVLNELWDIERILNNPNVNRF